MRDRVLFAALSAERAGGQANPEECGPDQGSAAAADMRDSGLSPSVEVVVARGVLQMWVVLGAIEGEQAGSVSDGDARTGQVNWDPTLVAWCRRDVF